MKETEIRQEVPFWENVLAPVMFLLSLEFLALLAAILVLWIYVPGNIEADQMASDSIQSANLGEPQSGFEQAAFQWGQSVGFLMLSLWPIFWIEQGIRFFQSKEGESYTRQNPYWWACCVFPPLRLCAQHRDGTPHVWLPSLDWQPVDRNLRKQLEKAFSVPMIFIALLILPVLGLELYFKERIVDYPALRIALHVGTGLIWFAFALEFIVMVSVTDKKLTYCKRHWLDLAIILLPLISFLRTLRVLRSARLLKVGKLPQLARMVRVYRLRGVTMRAFRALMLLEVIHRLLRISPEKRLSRVLKRYEEKQHELAELRDEIEILRSQQTVAEQSDEEQEDQAELIPEHQH